MMSFDEIGKCILFLFDNYFNDEELKKYIEKIDEAESDIDITDNLKPIIEILKNRNDNNYIYLSEMYKSLSKR